MLVLTNRLTTTDAHGVPLRSGRKTQHSKISHTVCSVSCSPNSEPRQCPLATQVARQRALRARPGQKLQRRCGRDTSANRTTVDRFPTVVESAARSRSEEPVQGVEVFVPELGHSSSLKSPSVYDIYVIFGLPSDDDGETEDKVMEWVDHVVPCGNASSSAGRSADCLRLDRREARA